LPEKTILEARIKGLSVVTFPAYKGATAQIAGEPAIEPTLLEIDAG
jgi:hypothetical protein